MNDFLYEHPSALLALALLAGLLKAANWWQAVKQRGREERDALRSREKKGVDIAFDMRSQFIALQLHTLSLVRMHKGLRAKADASQC